MQAVILAAGLGKRLGKLTERSTKFMVPINGRPLAEYSLDALVAAGIQRIVLVIGHGGAELRDFIGASYKGVPVAYVENPLYRETNNVYSMFLARPYLEDDDTLLLESDLIFDPEIIGDCLASPFANLAVVAKHEPWMDGTVVFIDDSRITRFISKDEFSQSERDRYFKTVNIYKLSQSFCRDRFMPFLQTYIQLHGSDRYYEDVLKVLVYMGSNDIGALLVGTRRWYEIDDIADLDVANALFASAHERVSRIHARYGGYWRFEQLKDFCYLANPYFPTQLLSDQLAVEWPRLARHYPSGMKVQQVLAGRMFRCDPSQIVVGNGASELIRALVAELPGRIGTCLPTFDEYPHSIAPERFVRLETSHRDFAVSTDELVTFAKDAQLGALVLINPANPSGQFIAQREVLALSDRLQAIGTRLVIDESFVDFADGTDSHGCTRGDVLDAHPELITIKSISKSYGIPGLRLGVLAASDRDIVARVARRLPIWNINSLAEWFLQIIGRHQTGYWHACRQLVAARTALADGLTGVPYLRVLPSRANYLLCELTCGVAADDLEEWLVNEHWILIKNCHGKSGFAAGEWIRLAVRDEADNRLLLDALAQFAAERKLNLEGQGVLS